MRTRTRRLLSVLAALAIAAASVFVASPAYAVPTSVTVTATGGVHHNGDVVHVTWSAADVNVGSVNVSIEGNSYFSNGSFALNGANAFADITLSSLSDGPHLVIVTVSGNGYTGQGATSITVDALGPMITITAPTALSEVKAGVDIEVAAVVEDLSGAYWQLTLDGKMVPGSSGTTVLVNRTIPGSLTAGWTEGTIHTIGIVAQDWGGLARAGIVRVGVAPAVPVDGLEITAPTGGGWVTPDVVFAGTMAPGTYSSPFFTIDGGGPIPISLDSGAFSFSTTGLPTGLHTFLISEGPYRHAETVIVNIDSDVPVISILSPAAGSVYGPGAMFGINLLLTDSSGINWTASLDGNPLDSGTRGSATGETLSFGVSADSFSEGLHTFAISGTDLVGRTVGPVEVTFNVDRSGPTIEVLAPTVAWINPSTTATFDYQVAIEAGSTYEISVDWGSPISGTSTGTVTVPGISTAGWQHGGYHYVATSAWDSIGNRSDSTIALLVDTEAPSEVRFVSPTPGNVVSGASVEIAGIAADYGSGNGHVELTLFGVDVDNECNGIVGTLPTDEYVAGWFTTSLDSTDFADGKYCLRAIGYDRAGNSTTAWLRFMVIDNNGPAAPVALSPTGWVDGAGSRYFDWTDTTDMSGPVYYEYRIGDSIDLELDSFLWTTAPDSEADFGSELTGGPYFWQARGFDSLGNAGPWSPVARFRVLGTPEIDTCGCDLKFRNNLRVDWDYDFHGQVEKYEVQFHYEGDRDDDADDITFREDAGNLRHFTHAFAPSDREGAWFVKVRAKVAAGTWTDWSERVRFIRDLTDPETPTLVSPDDGGFSGLDDWFKWTKSEDDLYQFRFSVDGVTGGGNLISPQPFDPDLEGELLVFDGHKLPVPLFYFLQGVPEGDFWWQVRAVDAAGNKSAWSEIRNTTIDLTEPEKVLLDSPADASTRSVDDVTFGWEPPLETGLSYQLEVGPSSERSHGALEGSTRHSVSTLDSLRNDLPEGTWFWRVRAIDAAGNEGAWSQVWSVTIDVPAVTPVIPPKGSGSLGNTGSTEPNDEPTPTPTPTVEPTDDPTDEPTQEPTAEPTAEPNDDSEASGDTEGGFPLIWILIGGILIVVIAGGGFLIRFLVIRGR